MNYNYKKNILIFCFKLNKKYQYYLGVNKNIYDYILYKNTED